MNKLSYIKPEITVVEFKVESGFQGSMDRNMLGAQFERDRSSRYYTGESYTDFTDDGGSFSTGRWGSTSF